jgi:hypothetical protein
MLRAVAVGAALMLLSACTHRMSQAEAEDASIEELRAARAKMTDIGNVDVGLDREPYAARLVTQAGRKLGWPEADIDRASRGIAWKGMTRDQLWWSWGPPWKEEEGDPDERWEWGPWHLGEPRKHAIIRGDLVTDLKVNPPPD